VWIANDAEDRILCFDASFLPLVEKIAPLLTSVQHFVLMTSRAHMPASSTLAKLLCFDELLDAESGDYVWPVFDENTASSIC
ncbi:long-chain fatty acid--CoA ligase, partial [Acinetobacter baumannii]